MDSTLSWLIGIQTLFIVGYLLYFMTLINDNQDEVLCRKDVETGISNCIRVCPIGQFALTPSDICRPLLDCGDLDSDEFEVHSTIGNGAVKVVQLATWRGQFVALNSLLDPEYAPDFREGLSALLALQPSPHVTKLVGVCGDDTFVTEYHKFGSADRLDVLFAERLIKHDTPSIRFGLCISYVRVIHFLHEGNPLGTTRVMCDSNDLNKTLLQFLVASDLQLLANDLDALPEVKGRGVKCGSRKLGGDFVAPEQRSQEWSGRGEESCESGTEDGKKKEEYSEDSTLLNASLDDVEPYDEKTDIWKIPDVCEHFLRGALGMDALRFRLFAIHKRCKSEKAVERPTASEVLKEYRDIQQEYEL